MQSSTKFPAFLFFSEVEAINFCDCASSLLAWSGRHFPLSCLKLAREYVSRIEAPEHKITLEGAEDLLALLGTYGQR